MPNSKSNNSKTKRLADIITELYQQYLPDAEHKNIQIDLDLSDRALTVATDETKADLSKHIQSAVDRGGRSQISLKLQNGKFSIHDNGTILSQPACQFLSKGRVKAKSRLGFGTTVTIDFTSKPSANADDHKQAKPTDKALPRSK